MYFDQRMHACACVCMDENSEKRTKILIFAYIHTNTYVENNKHFLSVFRPCECMRSLVEIQNKKSISTSFRVWVAFDSWSKFTTAEWPVVPSTSILLGSTPRALQVSQFTWISVDFRPESKVCLKSIHLDSYLTPGLDPGCWTSHLMVSFSTWINSA